MDRSPCSILLRRLNRDTSDQQGGLSISESSGTEVRGTVEELHFTAPREGERDRKEKWAQNCPRRALGRTNRTLVPRVRPALVYDQTPARKWGSRAVCKRSPAWWQACRDNLRRKKPQGRTSKYSPSHLFLRIELWMVDNWKRQKAAKTSQGL